MTLYAPSERQNYVRLQKVVAAFMSRRIRKSVKLLFFRKEYGATKKNSGITAKIQTKKLILYIENACLIML